MPGSGIDQRNPEIIVLPDRRALGALAAERFVSIARAAITKRASFSVALSGGSTPGDLYRLLATPLFSSRLDWSGVHIFWGDERTVAPDHPDSNYRMADQALLSRVPIPSPNVNRIQAELEPELAANGYEQTLRAGIQNGVIAQSNEGRPRFDLILLGLGPDGHTASLFPHTRALRENQRWVAANYVDKLLSWRLTLTFPVLNAAENILFLVAGSDKADSVHAVLRGEPRPDDFPAQSVQPMSGNILWLLDMAANEKLKA